MGETALLFARHAVGKVELLAFEVSPWELILRGTLIYLGLLLLLRYVLRRDVGSLGTADLLFIVLVADAAQNAMSAEYRSVAEGVVLLGTLAFWNVTIDWLSYRFPAFRRIVDAPPMPLVKNGRVMRANLKRQWITVDELTAKLRRQGIESIEEVRLATLESDGEISVLKVGATDPARSTTPRTKAI